MRRLLAFHLALTMLLSVGVLQSFVAPAAPAVYADEPAADSDYDGIPDALDVAPNSNTFTGKMHSGHDGTTTVSFSMDYRSFFTDPTVYHPDLASVSVLGSALAYYTPSYGEAWFTYDTAQTWAGGTASKVDGVQLLQVLGFLHMSLADVLDVLMVALIIFLVFKWIRGSAAMNIFVAVLLLFVLLELQLAVEALNVNLAYTL